MKKPILDTNTKCIFKTLSERFGMIIGVKNYVSLPNVKFASKDALIIKDYFLGYWVHHPIIYRGKNLAAGENYMFLENEER
jgi:hypothetical protein